MQEIALSLDALAHSFRALAEQDPNADRPLVEELCEVFHDLALAARTGDRELARATYVRMRGGKKRPLAAAAAVAITVPNTNVVLFPIVARPIPAGAAQPA